MSNLIDKAVKLLKLKYAEENWTPLAIKCSRPEDLKQTWYFLAYDYLDDLIDGELNDYLYTKPVD